MFRRVGVMLGLTSLLLLVSIAVFLPSLIFSRGKRDAAIYTLSTMGASKQTTDKLAFEKWVEYTNNEIKELSIESIPDKPYSYLQKVLASKPGTSRVTNFTFTRGAGSYKTIKVRGEALTRQSLLEFQDNLKETGDWTQVDFPVSTIAEESNINFELSLIPTPKKQ